MNVFQFLRKQTVFIKAFSAIVFGTQIAFFGYIFIIHIVISRASEEVRASWQIVARAMMRDRALYLFVTIFSVILATGGASILSMLVKRRAKTFSNALRDIARLRWATRLPPAPDKDLLEVQQVFSQMATALEHASNQLKHLDSQRRRLFHDLAHELATPISSILAISDMLLDDRFVSTAEKKCALYSALQTEATRLEHLVNAIRELANHDDPDVRLQREFVNVKELLARVVQQTSLRKPPNSSIQMNAENCEAFIDAGQIIQVLVNLVENALRYIPSDGTIVLKLTSADSEIQLSVEDSGIGVPDDQLGYLGDRLLRIDPSRSRETGGHGLGLSIVKAIINKHQGAIRFGKSSLGGLMVNMTIPRKPRENNEY